MDTSQIPLFAMLRQRLGYLGERQRVIAQNVANADTPGYAPRDLKAFTFSAQLQSQQGGLMMQPATTTPGHLAGGGRRPGSVSGSFKPVKGVDSETTLDGNSVVLEDQMIKMSEARMQYDAAIGFYQKSMALLRMAARPPGR
ncbi:MAG TPA: flagellar basal body rod protein FlgB [Caulobacter sp.]|nr:flagellar basal body rod protein FlgB [Caulobacter sp.]